MNGNPIIAVRNLRKTFKSTVALAGISCDISCGHIIGLLGDNGAGKSTLLRRDY